jgi:hypothetical protein
MNDLSFISVRCRNWLYNTSVHLWLGFQLHNSSLPLVPNFSYLIASMGLQALWSLGLGCLDCYALILRRDLQQAFLMSLFVVGDWVNFLRHLFIHVVYH